MSKLRVILLMEADFNAMNMEAYQVRMMNNACKYKLIPEEIFSKKKKIADDSGLAKTLFYDISWQLRMPVAIASVNASNCYDCIAHLMASLVFQSFGVEPNAVRAMLETIEEMTFFLPTAYGNSKEFAGSTIDLKTQGLEQRNGAAPAGWCVISIMILLAHCSKGHSVHFLAPFSMVLAQLLAILYIDDTDMMHLDMEQEESIFDVHWELQESFLSWGKLLIATGGTLEPDKCFFHSIDFSWSGGGTWKYVDHSKNRDALVFLPLHNGSLE